MIRQFKFESIEFELIRQSIDHEISFGAFWC